MIILKYICGGIRIVLMVLIMIIMLTIYIIGVKTFFKHTPESGFKLRKVFLQIIDPILGFVEDIEGKPYDKPALYVSNHRGILDFYITMKYLNAYTLSKDEVKDIPILGYSAGLTGVFFVVRDNRNSRQATRDAIVEILKSGYNVLLYPEGTVNSGQTTKIFSKGAFEEAAKHGFPVVPIAQEYADKEDVWGDYSTGAQFFRQFGKCRTKVKLSFGQPIVSDNGFTLMNEAKKWIDNKLLEMQEGWSNAYEPLS